MKIAYPDRILNRHVGGNTTYTRALSDGVTARGHQVIEIPSAPHPALTMLTETAYGLGRHRDVLVHFSADTGPLVPTRSASVVTVHGVASRWIDAARTPRQERVWRTRVGRAIRSTDRVITVSQSSADDISEIFGVDRASVDVIPHGIDYEVFSAPVELSEEVSAQIPDRYVLYLGNLEPRKNLRELARAFDGGDLRDVTLVVAGRPAWNFEEILAEIDAVPNVVRLGFVSDQDRVALMQHSELFVFPSLYEGFGFPVLEAMAAGAPVASSRRGSLAEVAGPAAPIDDVSADGIREAVTAILRDDSAREQQRQAGREWAAQFSWDASVDAHLKIYEEVLGQ